MANNEFAVVVTQKGQRPNAVIVGSGATVRTALRAMKLDPETLKGQIQLDGKYAELGDRLSTNAQLFITPNTAGGR